MSDRRETIQTAIDGLRALASKLDEITTATESIKAVNASLTNVRASHTAALAELNELKHGIEHHRETHKAEIAAIETQSRSAKARLAELIDQVEAREADLVRLRTEHDQCLASFNSIRLRLAS